VPSNRRLKSCVFLNTYIFNHTIPLVLSVVFGRFRLRSAALASVPFGFVLVRVRVLKIEIEVDITEEPPFRLWAEGSYLMANGIQMAITGYTAYCLNFGPFSNILGMFSTKEFAHDSRREK